MQSLKAGMLLSAFCIGLFMPGADKPSTSAPAIPDFKCGYDGQVVSGFKGGKPICTFPAGFIVPDLKCPDSYSPQVLVGIHDGQPVCKGIQIYGDQNISANVAGGDSIYFYLHYTPTPPSPSATFNQNQ